jgi:PilZ domain-containing protein
VETQLKWEIWRGRQEGKMAGQGSLSMQEGANRRRSERVVLRMSVLVIAENEERIQMREEAETQVVNAHGGLLRMRAHLHVGQSFLLNNPKGNHQMGCRVVWSDEEGTEFYRVAFEFERPAPNFWPIVFPPGDWNSAEAS